MMLRVVGTLCILALAGQAHAQSPPADAARSTRAGVYTSDQAVMGSEVYAMNCVSCHSAVTHTGPAFAAKWTGQTLADLFGFIRESMPKNDPGTLSPREYLLAMVYVLQMNGMPPGTDPLPGDSLALNRIRIDFMSPKDTTRKR
jgi:mono/diheme cytochrome c family protein